jgi:hypothetical protein
MRTNIQSNFDNRDSLEQEKACKWEVFVRSDSIVRQDEQLAELSCRRELYACFPPAIVSITSRMSCGEYPSRRYVAAKIL